MYFRSVAFESIKGEILRWDAITAVGARWSKNGGFEIAARGADKVIPVANSTRAVNTTRRTAP